MSDILEQIIDGQSRLMERYELALKAIYDDPNALVKSWAVYGLTGGEPPTTTPSQAQPTPSKQEKM